MNTQKQIFLIITLSFMIVGGCAAYATIDLTIRADRQADFFAGERIERGALLYANNCRTCHGIQGEGGIGPALNINQFRDQSPLALEQNQEMLRRTITCGRAGTSMPPWHIDNGGSLTRNQIEHFLYLITAPEDPYTMDGTEYVNHGWAEAVRFARNLNAESPVTLAGDTLASIAQVHNVGAQAIADANGLALDDDLTPGMVLDVPTNGTYEVQENDLLFTIATDLNVGAIILAELNGLDYEVGADGRFHLITDSDDPLLLLTGTGNRTGLIPGGTLALPEGATYNAVPGDSLASIADERNISATELENLNADVLAALDGYDGIDAELPLIDDEGDVISLRLELPPVDAYIIQGQDLDDVAAGYANVTAASLAQANNMTAEDQPPVGKILDQPADSWGTAAPATINDGSACVEHIVADHIFQMITGDGAAPGIEVPDEFATDVQIVSHDNDWTVVADGTESEPNLGGVRITTGTSVTFENAVGVHNIVWNGDEIVPIPDFPQGAVIDLTFETAGEYDITCDVHPAMYALVVVEDAD